MRESICLHFRVGNEADLYGPAFREGSWNFERYWSEYQKFVKAVRARVPGAPFAGPDAASKVDWVTQFAERAKGDVGADLVALLRDGSGRWGGH
jgi:hypothetical protein